MKECFKLGDRVKLINDHGYVLQFYENLPKEIIGTVVEHPNSAHKWFGVQLDGEQRIRFGMKKDDARWIKICNDWDN